MHSPHNSKYLWYFVTLTKVTHIKLYLAILYKIQET